MSEVGRQGSSSQRTSGEPEEPPLRVVERPDAEEILTCQDQVATQEPPSSQFSVDLDADSQRSSAREEIVQVNFLNLTRFVKGPISECLNDCAHDCNINLRYSFICLSERKDHHAFATNNST